MNDRFPPEFVLEIAERFRMQAKQDQLAAALIRAGDKHDEAMEWRDVEDALKQHRDPLKKFAKKLGKLLDEWDGLADTTKTHLAYVGLIHRPQIRRDFARDGSTNLTAEQLAGRFRDSLAVLRELCETAGSEPFQRGNPGKGRDGAPVALDGLYAFAGAIEPFWREAVRTAFSDDHGRGGDSAPLDFLFECARRLDPNYTEANCETALRRLRKPKTRQ